MVLSNLCPLTHSTRSANHRQPATSKIKQWKIGNLQNISISLSTVIRWFGWFLFLALLMFAWKQSFEQTSSMAVDAFFFDKFERLKRITLPSAFAGLSSLLPGLTSGIRVCINFNSQYPQGYQQNTCFLCEAYRFNSIAYQCTGQSQIPGNINFTQANCIMNSCQPMMYRNRYPIAVTPPQQQYGFHQQSQQQP